MISSQAHQYNDIMQQSFCIHTSNRDPQLHTDGAGIYQGIERWWPVQHRRDIHKKLEFELTSEIEGLFGNLRTFIRRMYHHTTPEKLLEIVSEFCLFIFLTKNVQ